MDQFLANMYMLMKTLKSNLYFKIPLKIFEKIIEIYNRNTDPHSSLDMNLRSARSVTLKMRVLIRMMASLVQVFIAR